MYGGSLDSPVDPKSHLKPNQQPFRLWQRIADLYAVFFRPIIKSRPPGRRTLWFCTFLSSYPLISQAIPFDCAINCNLFAKESYPDFVVGTVNATASQAQARNIFHFAKQNGYWSNIPDDVKRFIELVQVVSITIREDSEEVEMSLLMSREEFDASPLQPGDLVRYTRHQNEEPITALFKQAETKPYWDVFGCIAVLCSQGDSNCLRRYVPGIYRFEDGAKLNGINGSPVTSEFRIDTETMLPLVGNQPTEDII